MEQSKPKSTLPLKIIIPLAVVGALILTCVGCIIAGAYFNSVGAPLGAMTRTAESVAASGSTTAEAALSATPTPTETPINTDTPTPTDTPTSTSTSTPTPTIPPETQTASAQETQIAQQTLDAGATKTAAAAALTATRAQAVANTTGTAVAIGATRTQQASVRTATAVAIGATQTQQASVRTATAVAAAATKTFLAQYKTIDYRELANYADNHIGETIQIRGRVFNIIDSETLQIWMAGSYEAAIVQTKEKFSGIYEDSQVTVYGTVAGFIEGTNAYGATIKQPLITDAFFVTPAPPPTPTPLPGGAVLISCAPNGGTVNVGNVQGWWIESPGGDKVAGNGNTGAYMYSFQRGIYIANDGSGPYVFCKGSNWSP